MITAIAIVLAACVGFVVGFPLGQRSIRASERRRSERYISDFLGVPVHQFSDETDAEAAERRRNFGEQPPQ